MILNAAVGALVNLVILVGLPMLGYTIYHRRKKRSVVEIARRAGLQVGDPRFIGLCGVVAAAFVLALILLPIPYDTFARKGSGQHDFEGLGLNATSIVMAVLYAVVKTGFAEELLFRGLIAGSLGRRLPLLAANMIQAVIFLLPHLLILVVMPELWPILVLVFVLGLFVGWVRIKSDSILGPWIIHAAVNLTMCLLVAANT